MQLKIDCPGTVLHEKKALWGLTKTCLPARQVLLIMKFTAILLFVAAMNLCAKGYTQSITLSLTNSTLPNAFQEIEKQSGYSFVYIKEQLQNTKTVDLSVKNENIETVLHLLFAEQPLTYTISGKYIAVKLKLEDQSNSDNILSAPPIDIHGKIVNEKGEPVVGVTITVKGTKNATSSDGAGYFVLKGVDQNAILIITGINIDTYEIKVNGRTDLAIKTRTSIKPLEETIIKGYYTTTKRLNTGNVGKLTSEDIDKQPVSNPILTLQGRLSGVFVKQGKGLPGAEATIVIRGQNSLSQGNTPLYIVDGVTFLSNNLHQRGFVSLTPFNNLNPSDIESIEILKDADATSIYGSRGANGVVLITTKKGKAGKTKLDFNAYSGISKITRFYDLLNTKEYLEVRNEAFKNDGVLQDISNAPDLLLWDTTRYTNWAKLLLGGTAKINDVNLKLSGGNDNTQFLFSAGFHHETTIYPSDNLADKRGSVLLNVTHSSFNKKFKAFFSAGYSTDNNKLIGADLALSAYTLLPNAPTIYNTNGELNWEEGGFYFSNPFANFLKKYNAVTTNVLCNANLSYDFTKEFELKVNLGINQIDASTVSTVPLASQNPSYYADRSAFFGNSQVKTWIVEPQIQYSKAVKKSKFDAQVGLTAQQIINTSTSIDAYGFTSDALIESLAAASDNYLTNSYNQYRTISLFGRLGYRFQDKYIINITGRRDGSSRFGTSSRFANFSALGIAWIFSKESFFSNKFPQLSFGKLRTSYGTTGNDQIGDYQYLDTWTPTQQSYQGSSGLVPTRLFNPEYSWEVNKKFEISLDLGFLKDRILISGNYFQNRSGNQLISYSLPTQTGFSSISKNFQALVENKGYEFELKTSNITTQNFKWSTNFNITFLRNQLLKFPGLDSSSYSQFYVIGKSLNTIKGYKFLGVNKQTGIYQYKDIDGDGIISFPNDYVEIGNNDPNFFGGIENSITYKRFQLDIFLQFVKQTGDGLQRGFYPGTRYYNEPTSILNRWRESGDNQQVQQYTTGETGSEAINALYNLSSSDANRSDASYVRVKNISISYNLSDKVLRKLKASEIRFSVQAQNCFTITPFRGGDPETQSILPPLKTIVFAFQISL